ncbi:arginine--tRNA ligase [Methylosinus sp. H3A]|uniref:arginine--tRNA ligase n=1 Tax=Methylosinus sp. H3A TaxID=2785786 RepID=UPI0018C29DE4|nr:arginine--tRNA ligase [Methylosinus sp. H3A]MBG0807929.1 arginine--tRNA ligase [Methylosinus sp. H3A]
MGSLLNHVNIAFGEAAESIGLSAEYGRAIRAVRPELGDFQCSGILGAARKLNRSAEEMADEMALFLRLKCGNLFENVTVVAPGYINVRVARTTLARFVAETVADPRLGIGVVPRAKFFFIDYGGPNVAKALHVGHLRSAVIGESLRRILGFAGHRVMTDIHVGDWGTPMGMLIDQIRLDFPNWRDLAKSDADCSAHGLTFEVLQRLYPVASAACKIDPTRAESARLTTAALQAGNEDYQILWRRMVSLSLSSALSEFSRLGAHFDLLLGESDSAGEIPDMLSDLVARNIAHYDERALVIPLQSKSDRSKLPPMIVEKADGAALYATTDLATILTRVRDFKPDAILYVVDQRQSLHFRQLFRAAEIAGYVEKTQLLHVAFGTVNGPDNKPFKTRDGSVMRLRDLLDLTEAAALKRLESSGHEEGSRENLEAIAKQVSVAALKFADLSSDRISGYVFDAEQMTSFEGKTGPYIQYAAVRSASVISKVQQNSAQDIIVETPEERSLILACLAFPEALSDATVHFSPDRIASSAFEIAQAFNRFYAACSIRSAPEKIRDSRIVLTTLASKVLCLALWLLGIETPEAM